MSLVKSCIVTPSVRLIVENFSVKKIVKKFGLRIFKRDGKEYTQHFIKNFNKQISLVVNELIHTINESHSVQKIYVVDIKIERSYLYF